MELVGQVPDSKRESSHLFVTVEFVLHLIECLFNVCEGKQTQMPEVVTV